VAVKIVSHDGDVGHRMDVLRESLLSANIQHPNVVSTYKARQRLAPQSTLTSPRGALGAAPSGGRMLCLTARRADKALQLCAASPMRPTCASDGPRTQRARPVWRHLRVARQPGSVPAMSAGAAPRASCMHSSPQAADGRPAGVPRDARPASTWLASPARAQVHTILHSAPQKPDIGPAGEPLDGHASGGSRGQLQTPHSINSNDGDEEIMETWLVLGAPPCKQGSGCPRAQGYPPGACRPRGGRRRAPASPCRAFMSGPELIYGRAPWHSFACHCAVAAASLGQRGTTLLLSQLSAARRRRRVARHRESGSRARGRACGRAGAPANARPDAGSGAPRRVLRPGQPGPGGDLGAIRQRPRDRVHVRDPPYPALPYPASSHAPALREQPC